MRLPRAIYGVIAGGVPAGGVPAGGVPASGVPAVGAAMSYIVLGERLAPRQWLGIAVMVVAAAGRT